VSSVPRLESAYAKAARALQHIETLKAQISLFHESNPCSVSIKQDGETKVAIYRVVVKQPSASMYLICGDIFQCLRSSLDHAVFELAASPSVPNPRWTQFPIFAEDTAEARKAIIKSTQGISPKALDVIKELQPYNRDKGVPPTANSLWKLHVINNIDKHRRITMRTTAIEIVTTPKAPIVPIEDGCEVTVPFGTEPALHPEFIPHVVFGDSSGITIQIDGIERIYSIVNDVVLPRLAGCF
jgi:hypothetical protein